MAKKKGIPAAAVAGKASPKDYEVYSQHNVTKTVKHERTGKVVAHPVSASDACQCDNCKRVSESK